MEMTDTTPIPAFRSTGMGDIEVLSNWPSLTADRLNRILGLPTPQSGGPDNGWFPGYGCRWCKGSLAWFTVLPYDWADIANQVAEIFRAAGATVAIGNEAGLTKEAGGRGLQVSAYAFAAATPPAMSSSQRKHMFDVIYASEGEDFKGVIDGTRSLMHWAKFGAGLCSELSISDAELRERYAATTAKTKRK